MGSIYIYRLYLSFVDTPLQISKWMIIVLVCLVVLDVTNFIIQCIVYQYNISSWFKLLYVDIIGLVIESMITIICLWLFNMNLFRLMVRMRAASISVSRNLNNREQQIITRQQILINRVVRNALLCSLTIMFWIFERMGWLLFDLYCLNHENSSIYYYGLFVGKCLTATALVMDACCMLFTFSFATKFYRKFCISCDRCCQYLCKKCVAKYHNKLEK